MKRKQENRHTFFKKVVYDQEKVFRYICMFLYGDFFVCFYVDGYKSLGITPNVIEGIFGVMLVMVEGSLFLNSYCDKSMPSHAKVKPR